VWIDVAHDSEKLRARVGGPGFSSTSAIVAALQNVKEPAILRSVEARDIQGELVADIPWPANERGDERWSAIRESLVDLHPVPQTSSMIPTLVGGDFVVILKGALRGSIAVGDPTLHRWHDGRTFMKRVVAKEGDTVAETDQGVFVNGTALATEELAGEYPYVYEFPGATIERSGKIVREHVGARNYPTLRRLSREAAFLRSKQRGSALQWSVPQGQVFILGDNRDDTTDSRYFGPIPLDSIVGRIVAIGFSIRDGVPDWERMGSNIQ
jgi:signal peptidase I